MNIIFALFSFFIDQYTKSLARKKLSTDYGIKKFRNFIDFRVVYNKGAFLGFLKTNKLLLNVVTWISIAVLFIVSFPFVFVKKFNAIGIAYSLILGGALSNAYDRAKKGKVTDFFSFYPKYRVYFNLADLAIFKGAVMLFIFGR